MKKKALGILVILLFCQCFKPVSGCLEIEAVNFNANADENCCCQYPKLIWTVNQNFGSDVFLDNRNYELPSGEWVKIKAISFYLSDFQCFENGKWAEVSDTLHISTFAQPTQKAIVKNDFAIVRRRPTEYSVGEFIHAGNFTEVKFKLGVPDPANQAIPTTLPSGHPLRPQPDKMWQNESEGYRFLMLAIARDTSTNAPVDTIYWTKRDFQPLPLEFSGNFKHAVGFDFKMTLTVDFRKWFEDIKISTDDYQQIKSKIVANLQSSFSVEQ